MKKVNVDLIVGASILIGVFILVTGVIWLKEVSFTATMVNYGVIFPEVGTLQLGDPVFINGVKKGSVQKIELRGTEVMTVLNIDRRVNITDSVRVSVVNVGLLGERGIGVMLSPHGRPVPNIVPSSRDTAFIYGRFDTGISEAMGMLGTVLAEVETLVVVISEIVHATIGDSAFIVQFHRLVDDLDTTLNVANRLLKRNEPLLNATFSDLRVVSRDLKDILDRNSAGLDSIVDGGQTLMARGLVLIEEAESLVVDVRQVIKYVEEGKGSLGKIYTDDTFYTELMSVLGNLDTLVNEIQEDALRLRVRLGFGRQKNKK